ncbi:Uncharacterised protein [Mycobacteroides abscessus subsp. abscessus]|nr:Uncharacterised protein [Mycobacteroides abscessus subsp. abscessus]
MNVGELSSGASDHVGGIRRRSAGKTPGSSQLADAQKPSSLSSFANSTPIVSRILPSGVHPGTA